MGKPIATLHWRMDKVGNEQWTVATLDEWLSSIADLGIRCVDELEIDNYRVFVIQLPLEGAENWVRSSNFPPGTITFAPVDVEHAPNVQTDLDIQTRRRVLSGKE